MSRAIKQTIQLATADADGIAQSQTPTTGFTINGDLATGGVATMDVQRRVILTTGGSEAGKTWTVTGTDGSGNTISETRNAPASATTDQTELDFKTVTSVTVSATFAAAATVGTNGVASTPWIPMDSNRGWPNWSMQVVIVSGVTANVMPQGTDMALTPGEMGRWVGQPTDTWPVPVPFDLQSSALTSSNAVYGDVMMHGMRLLVNSGATASPGVSFYVVQGGIAG